MTGLLAFEPAFFPCRLRVSRDAERESLKDRSTQVDIPGRAPPTPRQDSNTSMPAYKDPGFQERRDAAAKAKAAALAKLRAKPPVDEAVLAAKTAARLEREAAEAEKRRLAKQAKEDAAAALRQQALDAAAAAAAAVKPELTEAERKAEAPHPRCPNRWKSRIGGSSSTSSASASAAASGQSRFWKNSPHSTRPTS